MKNGILFIISAPSGAGKSTIINYLLNKKLLLNIAFSISHTTRMIRSDEIHGKHYYFISKEKFKSMIKQEKFIEYAKVFNNYYGTSYQMINNMLSKGIDIFLDVDWVGAKIIRKKFKFVTSIFIFPPSFSELFDRLKNRKQNSLVDIKYRMKKSINLIKHYTEYDYLIINDNFKSAVLNLCNIISATRLRSVYQSEKYSVFIKNLISKNIYNVY